MPPVRKTEKTTTKAAPKTRKRPRPGSEDAKMKKNKSTTTSKRPKTAGKKSAKKKSSVVIKSNDIENKDLRLLVSHLCGGVASSVIDTKTGKAMAKSKLFAKFKDILKSDKRLAGLKKQDVSSFMQIKVKSKRNKFTTIDEHLEKKTSSQKASKLLAKSKAAAFAEGSSATETRRLLLAKHKKIHAAVFIDA
eukprot:jgi/Bigna1/134237/aug1.24_g8945